MAQFGNFLSKFDINELPFLKAKQVVSVDVGDLGIKFVEIDFTGQKARISAFDIIPYSDEYKKNKNKEEQQKILFSLLSEAFQKHKVQAKEIVFAISGGSVFSRKIRVPKLAANEVESGIKWEASNQIPFSLDSSYFDWQLLREVQMPDGTMNDEYMIAASSRKTVDDMIELGLSLGLRPLCVGIPIFAIYNLVKISPQFDTDKRIAVIDIGSRRTNITIIEKKHIVFAREIPIGDDNINETILHEFSAEKWTYSIAEETKRQKKVYSMCMQDEHTIEDETVRRIMRVIRPLLERVFNEIKRSFDYYREQSGGVNVEMIALSGKGAMVDGFDEVFRKIYNIPVEFLKVNDLFVADSSIDVDLLGRHILDLTIVIGLGLGQTKQINFVPPQYRDSKLALVQMFIAGATVLLFLMILLALIFQVDLKVNVLQKQIDESNEQMAYIVPQVTAFNEKSIRYKKDKDFMDALRSKQLLLENALKELSNVVPRAITFKEIELMEEGWLRIEGYVFDDTVQELSNESVLTDFIIAIENSPFFTEVRLDSSARGDVFEVTHSVFLLNCKIISRKDIKEI
jgi:type IV pilus assembly protein PilM